MHQKSLKQGYLHFSMQFMYRGQHQHNGTVHVL